MELSSTFLFWMLTPSSATTDPTRFSHGMEEDGKNNPEPLKSSLLLSQDTDAFGVSTDLKKSGATVPEDLPWEWEPL